MNYRKIISSLNRELDTVQIKQCSKKWSKIDPSTQTISTMKRQKNAFLNLCYNRENQNMQERYELTDRIICADNFNDYSSEKYVSKNLTSDCNTPLKQSLLSETELSFNKLVFKYLDQYELTVS